jgi:hypothetical protein
MWGKHIQENGFGGDCQDAEISCILQGHDVNRSVFKTSGFVGNYVCQGCQVPCEGVYRLNVPATGTGKWVCDLCKKAEIDSNAKRRVAAYCRVGQEPEVNWYVVARLAR